MRPSLPLGLLVSLLPGGLSTLVPLGSTRSSLRRLPGALTIFLPVVTLVIIALVVSLIIALTVIALILGLPLGGALGKLPLGHLNVGAVDIDFLVSSGLDELLAPTAKLPGNHDLGPFKDPLVPHELGGFAEDRKIVEIGLVVPLAVPIRVGIVGGQAREGGQAAIARIMIVGIAGKMAGQKDEIAGAVGHEHKCLLFGGLWGLISPSVLFIIRLFAK